jgi:hypothetical protein
MVNYLLDLDGDIDSILASFLVAPLNAYAYAGVSGEARTGQTLYGGSVGVRLAF